jgi:hypothetical protein
MAAWKPYLIALALGLLLGSGAEAQGVVPGGWAPQFGYQAFVGPGVAGFGVGAVSPGYGYGTTFPGLSPYYPAGGLTPYYRPGIGAVNAYTPSSQTVNAIDPLIGAIRQSTRRRGAR